MIKLTQDTRPDDVGPDFAKPEALGDVRAWSYSALKVYEECAYRTYISRVKGVKEPSGPAADRGTQIHQYAEDYVDGTMGEMHDSLFKFKDEFYILDIILNQLLIVLTIQSMKIIIFII